MKKLLSKILAVSMVASMLSTSVFAADIVEIDGYGEGQAQVSLSNVISTDGETYMQNWDGTLVTTYVCDGSATITTLDGLCMFDIYQIASQDDVYTPIETTNYVATGEVSGYGSNGFVTFDINELDNEEYMYLDGTSYKIGTTFEVTEPGAYYVSARYEAIAGSCAVVFEIADENGEVPIPELPTLAKEAIPTSATVLVDGEEVAFDAYEIEGNNYFKLRDIATVLSGTEAEFNVGYDEKIMLVMGQAYDAVGGELAAGDGITKSVFASTDYVTLFEVTVNEAGEESKTEYYVNPQPAGYNIEFNNYYQLRGLGSLLGFNVTWDEETQTILIDSTSEYIG